MIFQISKGHPFEYDYSTVLYSVSSVHNTVPENQKLKFLDIAQMNKAQQDCRIAATTKSRIKRKVRTTGNDAICLHDEGFCLDDKGF